MATPIGHYLFGLSLSQALGSGRTSAGRSLLLAAVACLPDLDVLPGLLVGELGRFHHGVSHSVAAAILFAVGAGLFLKRRVSEPGLRFFAVLFLLYLSHSVLDFFSLDTGAPYGIPLLWPLSQETYQSPWVILPNVYHTVDPVFSWHNVLLAVREILVFGLLVGLTGSLRASPAWPLPARTWLWAAWFIVALLVSVNSINQA